MQLGFYSPTQESEERRCAGFARLIDRHGDPSGFRGCASTKIDATASVRGSDELIAIYRDSSEFRGELIWNDVMYVNQLGFQPNNLISYMIRMYDQ
jgi:hypothetical protein